MSRNIRRVTQVVGVLGGLTKEIQHRPRMADSEYLERPLLEKESYRLV